jgi:hypothetical protein
VSDIPERYVELGLRLGRHVDALVDSYYGPTEFAERVAAEDPRPPAKLARDASALAEEVDRGELDGSRGDWLRAQLVGLETVARRLAGEEIPFAEEVERCYGVRPERLPEERFEAAHQALDEALPGSGPVAERYQAWREGDPLPKESLSAVIESLRDDLKERTLELVGLPGGELVAFEYVSDEPWSAYNYYLGGLRSRIAVNTDVPMTPSFLVEVVSHETYPGHHTEHAWKEQLLVRERDRLEETISMIGTPESLVSEGIAGLAVEMALGEEEQEVTAAHVSGTGVAYDPEVARAVQEAARQLEGITANVALMLHADGCSRDEAQAYLMRWALASEERADRALRFYTDPVWRSYATTYTDGYRLCRAFVDGDPARFKRLLTEQLTPADLSGRPSDA